MTSVRQLIRDAKKAYYASAHVEQEWLAKELGDDLDAILDALTKEIYPEQFTTTWEKLLYEALQEVVEDLDLKNFPRPHIERLLRDFKTEQQRRLKTRTQMETFQLS